MKKVSLLFGIHMHQPVDNFDEAVQKAVELCYEPFFQTMVKYPKFKFSLHCSGWLLNKIRTEYPKLFENMQILTQQGAIEWFGGGYYEPVLSCLPSKDRRAQIKKLNCYIKKHFKVKPQGLWLTERVWDSSLAKDLHGSGIKYAMVDDYHFLSNRYDADKMNGYYTTEDNGYDVALFPIAKKLRYCLPFSNVDDAVAAVLAYQKEENSTAVIFDDAEKFGLWPDTNKWVYEQGWLEKFVEAILENENIVTGHYGEYIQKNNSLGLAYLDNCSYEEMGEWSLQTQAALEFKNIKNKIAPYIVKGGIWKNFFIKYHESNYLHKRMLYLSSQQKYYDKYSIDALYRLQTNDAFWHGIFGGFYLPSLRDNAYKYLLEIEQQRAKEKRVVNVLDIDKDGYAELKILTPNLSLLFSTKNGAQMIEFGSFDTLFNWQNTIMRRQEPYHSKIFSAQPKEKNHSDKAAVTTIHNREVTVDASLKAELIYDWHAKNSFIDHFSHNEFTLQNFKNLTFKEVGDFANKPFVLKNKKFMRNGAIYLDDGVYASKLHKKYSFDTDAIYLKSKFKTEYAQKLYFAQEFNLHFAHPQQVTFNQKSIEEGFCEYDTQKLLIRDDFTKKDLIITANQKCNIFAFILHTVSQSESGFEKIPQQISFIFTTEFASLLQLELSLEIKNV